MLPFDMMKLFYSVFFFFSFVFAQVPENCRQLILSIGKHWDQCEARVCWFEKIDGQWVRQSEIYPATLGNNGLGWGIGEHTPQNGIQKVEGDQKAPCGIFKIGVAFGLQPLVTKLPFILVTNNVHAVDDPHSKYYNTIQNSKEVEGDWNSSEKMWEKVYEVPYFYGFEVKHNYPVQSINSGSAIFFHVWRGPGDGTFGCTAMEKEVIKTLIEWIDLQKNPLVVQLPQSEYEALKDTWALPQM
jgi:D-alanyl-D-alanine dipeptidase